MARLNVNPTRMELNKLKKRIKVARRGHKLLKDKRDELMKKFIIIVKENKTMREKMEEMIKKAHDSFIIARAIMPFENLEEALMIPKKSVQLNLGNENIMSVNVPKFLVDEVTTDDGNIYPYGLHSTSGELDGAIYNLTEVLPIMLKLAELEKTTQLMAREIEKTRRRVNALEYVMIPQLQETIKYITMKLDENERGNTTRLMKVKDMMLEQQRT
ncbi:MAG: V-type ATP synthase subunit D [Clostridiales bacterium]|nr:V-type ATP synthase subunit D [Clostridiales bacterium]